MTSILKVDTIQDADGNNIINESGNTITIGASGDTTNIIGTLQNNGSAVGGVNTPAFHAYRSGNQSIANATYTDVIYNVEYFDTASAFDTSTGAFTVPSGQAGKYLLTFNVRRGNWHSDRFIGTLEINGSDRLYVEDAADASANFGSASAAMIFDLSAGDVVKVQIYHNNGSSQNIEGASNQGSNFFTGMKIIE